MLDKIADQFQNSFKPMGELAAINARALEQLAKQHSELFVGVLHDGVAYTESLTGQKDLSGLAEAQKAYATNVQEKLLSAGKCAYSVLTETQEQAGEVMKQGFAEAREATEKTYKPNAGKTSNK